MNRLQILSASVLLLPTLDAVAESTEPGAFLIELNLADRLQRGRVIEVRCAQGCDWTWKTLECPAGETDCRAFIAASSLYDPKEPMPRAARACMGVSMGGEGDPEVSPDVRTRVIGVVRGSPADQAGFKKGDVLVSFNREPVQGPRPVWETVHRMVPGQSFDATVERDGELIDVQGHVGTPTAVSACAPLDESQLQNVSTEKPEFTDFEIAVKLTTNAVFRCLKGCYWADFVFERPVGFGTCEIRLGTERQGMSCQEGPRPE